MISRGLGFGLLVTSGVALGVVACAGILGIDDRSLEDGGNGPGGDDGGVDALGPGTDGGGHADGDGGGGPGSDGGGTDGGSTEGGTCSTDPCVMATGLDYPFLMTSDANNVYWTEFGDALGAKNGAVKSCPVSGCLAGGPKLYANGLLNPRGIVVDAQNVYFGTATYGNTQGGIQSCPISGCTGGTPTTLAPASIPFGIAVDATYVYWADNDDNSVHRVKKIGGTDTVLYDGGTGLIVEGTWCVVDSNYIFVSDANQDVVRFPINGGAPSTVAAGGLGAPCPLTLDSANIYYGANGGIIRASKTSNDGGTVIASSITDTDSLVIDPTTSTLYWSDYGSSTADDGTVGKVGTDGGGQKNIGASLVTPESVAVSGAYVFWITNGTLGDSGATAHSGTLMRTEK
jgi:hypothetical protein